MLKDALISAALTLSDMKKQVDELNVYPVPDGDTGTNMSLTLTNAMNALQNLDDGAAVSDSERAHARLCRAMVPMGGWRGFLAYAPTPYAVRWYLGGRGLRDRAGDGNGLRSISGPAVPVLCPHDDRHPLFPGRYDAEPDAVGEWRNVVFGYCVGFHACSASSFPETRCAKICLKGWFSVGARGRHF